MKRFFSVLSGIRPELWVFALAHVAGTCMALIVLDAGITVGTGDQAARLNFARFALESLTPGVTQVGFLWRPLLHIALIPLAAVQMFYRTGIAGPLLLVPCFAASASLLYAMVFRLTRNAFWAWVACAVFALNPYMLYFASVPMTETLFILLIFMTTHSVLRWLETDKPPHVLFAAVYASLAFLCRIEGIMLLPLIIMIAIGHMLRRRQPLNEMVALLLLFLWLSSIGVGLTVLYGFAYHGNALAFLQPTSYLVEFTNFTAALESYDQIPYWVYARRSIVIIIHALWYVLGQPLSWIVAFALSGLLFVRRKFDTYSILALLLSPLMFIVYGMLHHRVAIAVPELPRAQSLFSDPSNELLDVRYVMTAIGFYVAVVALFGDAVARGLAAFRWRFVEWIVNAALASGLIALVIARLSMMIVSDFHLIRIDGAFAARSNYVVSEYLREEYDFGNILVSQTGIDHRTFIAAGIPLTRFVQDANYKYFDQAAREPWLFTRWVSITVNPGGRAQPALVDLQRNPAFHYYFDVVLQGEGYTLYRLNEQVLRATARRLNIDPLKLPSLNPYLGSWDPATVYQTFARSRSGTGAVNR